jgi:uncharacterized membrane protein HdeD (DUF308 family)
MRAVAILMGILMIIGGFAAMMMPGMTFFSLSWLIGLCMIIESIGEIFTLADRRKSGAMDGWSVLSAVLSMIVGVALISSLYAREVLSSIFVYLIAAWIIVLGVMAIMKGRRDRESGGLSWLPTLLGLLMIFFGIIGIISPSIIAISTGMFAAIGIILTGISLSAAALSY